MYTDKKFRCRKNDYNMNNFFIRRVDLQLPPPPSLSTPSLPIPFPPYSISWGIRGNFKFDQIEPSVGLWDSIGHSL